ncbi:MAG: MFS transporter [Nakamurella sp.]
MQIEVTRRAWAVWGIGAGVYMLAVFNRSTLGVAGPDAMQRFGIESGALSIFITIQLVVYAGMQVPAGILIDRFGPRRMLLTAALVMAVGQLGFAVAPNYPLALVSRAVLGCGDAMTYVSVLRLISAWFPGPRYPLLTAFSGFFGVVGNVLATVPLAALLPVWGWAPTFSLAGGLCLVYALVLIRKGTEPAPYRTPSDPTENIVGGIRIADEVARSFHEPGGRLGFWVHFTTMSGSAVFTVLWGFPYLTAALGYSRGLASTLVLLLVVSQSLFSVTAGALLGRRPSIRVPLAFGVSILNLAIWGVLIGWPGGHPPLAVMVILMIALAVGGPSSMVGFMLARDYNPRHRISTATGLVNSGGWIATLVGVLLVGQILDIVEPGPVKTTTGYRWAFVAILVLTAFGLFRLTVWWLRVRRQLLELQDAGGQGPVEVHRHRFDRSVGPAVDAPARVEGGTP